LESLLSLIRSVKEYPENGEPGVKTGKEPDINEDLGNFRIKIIDWE
jgi:hypothetical protein